MSTMNSTSDQLTDFTLHRRSHEALGMAAHLARQAGDPARASYLEQLAQEHWARIQPARKFHEGHVLALQCGQVILRSGDRCAILNLASLPKPVQRGLECSRRVLQHAAEGRPSYPTAGELLGAGKAAANNLRNLLRAAKEWAERLGFPELANGVLGQIRVGRDGTVTYNPSIRVEPRFNP